jgi:hypothetical protein
MIAVSPSAVNTNVLYSKPAVVSGILATPLIKPDAAKSIAA